MTAFWKKKRYIFVEPYITTKPTNARKKVNNEHRHLTGWDLTGHQTTRIVTLAY